MSHVVSLDDLWIGVLADLAFKLHEVVGHRQVVLLHNHLGLDPSLQAVDVHNRTASLAAAGRHEEVVFLLFFSQADLALSREGLV